MTWGRARVRYWAILWVKSWVRVAMVNESLCSKEPGRKGEFLQEDTQSWERLSLVRYLLLLASVWSRCLYSEVCAPALGWTLLTSFGCFISFFLHSPEHGSTAESSLHRCFILLKSDRRQDGDERESKGQSVPAAVLIRNRRVCSQEQAGLGQEKQV